MNPQRRARPPGTCSITTPRQILKQQALHAAFANQQHPFKSCSQALGLTNFCDASDSIILEDEGARLALRPADGGGLPVATLVTGAVAAVRGRAEAGGDFIVSAEKLISSSRRRGMAAACNAGGGMGSFRMQHLSQAFLPHLPCAQPRFAHCMLTRCNPLSTQNTNTQVTDICFAGLAPQPPRPVFERDTYVALVSGLELAGSKADKLQVGAAGSLGLAM